MADTEHGRAVIRKVAWRLIPILGLCYFAAFLDRVNTGFAALTMSSDGSLIFLAAVCVVAAAVALLLGRTMRNLLTTSAPARPTRASPEPAR